MRNHKEKPRERPDASLPAPEEVKKDDAPTPLAGHDNQDSSGASQQDAPITGAEALDRKSERKDREQDLRPESPIGEIDIVPEAELSGVPVDMESSSSVDGPKPKTDVSVPDERETPKPLVPDEIRQFEEDAHQEFEESLMEIEQDYVGIEELKEKLKEELRGELKEELKEELKRALKEELQEQKALEDIAKLGDQAWSDERAGIEQDQKELGNHFAELKHWRERISVLREDLKAAVDVFNEVVIQSRSELKNLSQDAQESLESRQIGLNLIYKMLRQQVDRGEMALPVNEDPIMELPAIGEQGWQDVVNEIQGDSILQLIQRKQKDIQRKLKDIEQKRYQVIMRIRESKEKYRKRFLAFTEKQLLPVLDSIDDGEEHSRLEVKRLKTNNPGVEEQFDKWFQTYDVLRKSLLSVLEKVGICPMVVEIGKPIQYDRHEPFDTESDPKLENESIKSIMRKGYEYKSPDGAEIFVLRSAQVIVVKNEKEE